MNNLSAAKVLIVDDFQGMRTMLRDFLKTFAINDVDTAGNGKDAINLLSKKKFDIVLCDYNLGDGKNGQQVLEEAKHRRLVGYATVWVIVTAEKTMDMVMGAVEYQPDDYLLKPVNQAVLKARLEKLVVKKASFGNIERAVDGKNYGQALALCDQLLRTDPSIVQDVLRLKGQIYLTMGDYEGAQTLFAKVLAVRQVPWAKTGLGKTHFLTGKYLEAKEALEAVVEEHKTHLEAYDWLAKTLAALGDFKGSQTILENAANLSPKSVARQRMIGEVAHKNGNLDLAEESFKKSIKLAEFSVLKSPDAYTGLAKVLLAQDRPEEAIKSMEEVRKEFRQDPVVALQSAVVDTMAYHSMGDTEKANAAIAEAKKTLQEVGNGLNSSVALDVAKALFQIGDREQAEELLSSVVRNNHENEQIIKQVEDIFEGENLQDEGDSLIRASKDEVVKINDQGVLLAREGKLDDGVKLLRKALAAMPNNVRVLLNLVGMQIALMRQHGREDKAVYEIRELLDRARKIDPSQKKLLEYMQMIEQVN